MLHVNSFNTKYTIALHCNSDSLIHILHQPSNGTPWRETETSAIILFICHNARL